MSMTRRLQLLLDEDRYQKIAAVASEQQRSVASVIREAIDRSLSISSSRRAAAGQAILDAEPFDVPDLDELRRELDEMHTKHA
jgi:hypothetical protein